MSPAAVRRVVERRTGEANPLAAGVDFPGCRPVDFTRLAGRPNRFGSRERGCLTPKFFDEKSQEKATPEMTRRYIREANVFRQSSTSKLGL